MIDEEIKKLSEWLEKNTKSELPSFKELPSVPLYMEQVVSYVNSTLSGFLNQKDALNLTSFMVNNYVKAKIIKEPERKKYNEEHLGYLLAISFLKRTLSMSELSLLIQMDADVSTDKSALYHFFRSMLSNVMHDSSEKTKYHLDDFYRLYEKIKKSDPEKADKLMADSLALMALRLSVKASVYSLISSRLLESVSSLEAGVPLPDDTDKLSKKERKRAQKNAVSEAERVAKYVEKGEKKRKEDELRKTRVDLEKAKKAVQKSAKNNKNKTKKKGKNK